MAVAGGICAPPPSLPPQQPPPPDGCTAPLLPSLAMSPAVVKPPTPPQHLVLMPATAEHNLARLRWHAAQYSLRQLQEEGERLRAAVNAMLPLLLRHHR